jgi:AAA domain-containing protein
MALITAPARFTDLLAKELPANFSYIEPALLTKGGTLLFGGDAKIGKSLIMLEMARGLATGVTPFGCPQMIVPEPVKVMVIEQEVGERGLQLRGSKILATVPQKFADNLWYITQEPDMQFDSEQGRKLIIDAVGRVEPNVLFLDPISRMHGYDENDNGQINKLVRHLANLKKMFKHKEMSIVISHHYGKPPRGQDLATWDPLDFNNFRGASKFRDDADALITVQKLKFLDTPHKAWKIKTRYRLRHGEEPNDMIFTVNKENDLRVRWERTLSSTQELKPEEVFKTKQAPQKPTEQEKLMFMPG